MKSSSLTQLKGCDKEGLATTPELGEVGALARAAAESALDRDFGALARAAAASTLDRDLHRRDPWAQDGALRFLIPLVKAGVEDGARFSLWPLVEARVEDASGRGDNCRAASASPEFKKRAIIRSLASSSMQKRSSGGAGGLGEADFGGD